MKMCLLVPKQINPEENIGQTSILIYQVLTMYFVQFCHQSHARRTKDMSLLRTLFIKIIIIFNGP